MFFSLRTHKLLLYDQNKQEHKLVLEFKLFSGKNSDFREGSVFDEKVRLYALKNRQIFSNIFS